MIILPVKLGLKLCTRPLDCKGEGEKGEELKVELKSHERTLDQCSYL